MAIEVDQSGKVEDTSKDTVVAYSNDTQYAVLVTRKVKRQIQEFFRLKGLNRLFTYFLFSYVLYRVLVKMAKTQRITVDVEYPGKEDLVRKLTGVFFKQTKKKAPEFNFGHIGNHPRAHYAAKNVLDRKIVANEKILLTEVFEATKIADGHLRECFSTLVDAQPRLIAVSITKKRKNVKI